MTGWEALFWLFGAHFVCDFPLQSDFIAQYKHPEAPPLFGRHAWIWIMSAHAATHAVGVALVLGPVAGYAEFLAHFSIDVLKCRGFHGFHSDQVSHLVSKVIWLLVWGPAL